MKIIVDNGIPIPGVTVERQKKEAKWMLTFQSVYPYGQSDRIGDEIAWQKKKVEWPMKSSYYYIIYTNIQIIITLKLNLIILS